ncbi:hypothetical protein AN390_00446 [Pseudoalteromonas sp. P1-11]|jgi:hypothetical protein|nr:hypothetical protein AN390_00446 [Pseudoalteromonas sp. P1-11]
MQITIKISEKFLADLVRLVTSVSPILLIINNFM